VSFAAITLCVAPQQVFFVVVYFVIDSVRKLLVTLLYVISCPSGLCDEVLPHHFRGMQRPNPVSCSSPLGSDTIKSHEREREKGLTLCSKYLVNKRGRKRESSLTLKLQLFLLR
jgi:hypothetical protein